MPPNSSDSSQPVEPNVQLAAKHSLLTRTLHWLNAVAIGALVGTGIALLIGGDALEAIAGSIHEVFYFLLLGIGAVYLISLIVSGGWRMFVPTRETVADAFTVVKSELRLGAHAPRLKKYNGAQRLAYGAVLLMVAGEVLTGLAMAYRHQMPWLGVLLGGRHTVHTIHKVLMFGILAFVLVHVVQVIRAGWPSLRSMLCGYDIVPVGSSAAIDGHSPITWARQSRKAPAKSRSMRRRAADSWEPELPAPWGWPSSRSAACGGRPRKTRAATGKGVRRAAMTKTRTAMKAATSAKPVVPALPLGIELPERKRQAALMTMTTTAKARRPGAPALSRPIGLPDPAMAATPTTPMAKTESADVTEAMAIVTRAERRCKGKCHPDRGDFLRAAAAGAFASIAGAGPEESRTPGHQLCLFMATA
jgi:thiosulfate reductase cytochrome b subunit